MLWALPAAAEPCVATVDLGDDEVGSVENGTVFDAKKQPLFTLKGSVSHGIAGHENTATSLLDLDGDGRYELIERTTRFDDTGHHAAPPVIHARGADGRFAVKKGLKTPRERAAKELAATNAMTNVSLGSVTNGACDPTMPAGPLAATIVYPKKNEKGPTFPYTLHVTRPYDGQVVASAEVGVMSEAFTSQDCRLRARVGTPLLTVRRSKHGGARRILVAVWPSGATRQARAFLWDGRTLTASQQIELDRCDTQKRTVAVDEGDTLVVRGVE